jgi:tetratricopeptide (TPR) repeat protein
MRLLAVGLALVALAGGALLVLSAMDVAPVGIRGRNKELLRLWNENEYEAVFQIAESVLDNDPLDGEALTFGGFARFYLGIQATDRTDQLDHLHQAIVLLRRALHVPNAPLAAERDYVLGKAYFHRGDEYVDLSIYYLERSLQAGYDAPDTRTYLGLAHALLEQHDQGVAWFERAIERAQPGEVDAVRIRVADSYVALGEFEAAGNVLRQAVETLEDAFLVLIARNQLASVLIRAGRFDDAESLLNETLEIFPQSADAMYYMGIVYDETGRGVQARNSWRAARDIDPNHTDALMRLANWGR